MIKHRFTILLILVLFPFASQGQLNGKVVSIADGDTFTLLVEKQEIRIRLHGIDCPEKIQDFGMVAKKFLSDLVFGKIVTVEQKDVDQYGRTIGIVFVDSLNINEQLLMAGLAWHYKRYDQNQIWARLESNARTEKKGLWVQQKPIAPWEFRKQSRENKIIR